MEIKVFLTELRLFKLRYFGQLFSHYRVWNLCNQLLSMDIFQILHTFCGQHEDVHVEF